MPFHVTSFEPTPNPNAVKCLVEPGPGTIRSYFSADQAADDPLGSALFSIPGVTNVLIHQSFISICKSPDTRWTSVKPAIKRVLADAD